MTHVAGEPVEHIVAAQDTDEANSHIADDTTDDHSQYVHMQHNRTVSATHTFTAPVNFTDHPNFSHIGSSMPLVVNTGAADPGVSPDQARTDHKHDIDVAGIMKFFFPVGIPFMCYQPSAPAGWLFYNGQAVSRTTYPDLFGLFGVTQGAGDGFSTFNLPDMRGRVAVVADATHPLLATGGNLTHTMATNEMPVHNHGVNDNGHAHTITDPGHTHGVNTGDDTGFRIGISHVSTYGFTTASIAQAMTLTGLNHERTNISVNNSNTGITTQTTGGTTAVSLKQPWIAVNYITYGR